MCGIVAAFAINNIFPVLVEAMKKFDFRGCGPVGLAVLGASAMERVRAVARAIEFDAALVGAAQPVAGVPHHCWAADDAPRERNDHLKTSGSVALVHKNIVENYESLCSELSVQA